MHKNTDLSDYCEGVDKLTGKKKLKVDLSTWISCESVDIYWRQNNDRYPSFEPVGHPAPDLLIDGKKELYAVCVVQSEGNSEKLRKTIRKAVNIWERMVTEPPDYDQRLCKDVPSAVLVATEQSSNGHLFCGTKNREHPVEFSEKRQEMANKGILPQREFAATQEVIRSAWGFAKEREESDEIGIGALLSSRLDTKEDNQTMNTDPSALYYTPGANHVHHWESIPWSLRNKSRSY